jgi:hypothetical protein
VGTVADEDEEERTKETARMRRKRGEAADIVYRGKVRWGKRRYQSEKISEKISLEISEKIRKKSETTAVASKKSTPSLGSP